MTPEGTGAKPLSGSNLVLEHPFTARKLLNRVDRFIPGKDEAEVLQVGKISLLVNRRIVRCMERESRLTPKQAELLELFLRNPGRVMTRESL